MANNHTRVAIVGIQGIPAHYGGFETLVENLVKANDNSSVDYTVFCSSKDMPSRVDEVNGARLKYIPLHSNGIQSILYDILSMLKCIRGYDSILILGVSGCIFVPVLRLLTKARIVINIDGLEHRRQKWGRFARWFLRLSEKMAVKGADVIVADNKGIQDYVSETYHRDSALIAYGGDHVLTDVSPERQLSILSEYGLLPQQYAVSICRIEPENNVEMALSVFARNGMHLVMVGNFSNNVYSRALKDKYGHYANIHLIESCYDLQRLHALRHNASFYIHGHSAGGTNPSLVEAMFFGRPILAFDVCYNRFTTDGLAEYYGSEQELEQLVALQRSNDGNSLCLLAKNQYVWKKVACDYEKLLFLHSVERQ